MAETSTNEVFKAGQKGESHIYDLVATKRVFLQENITKAATTSGEMSVAALDAYDLGNLDDINGEAESSGVQAGAGFITSGLKIPIFRKTLRALLVTIGRADEFDTVYKVQALNLVWNIATLDAADRDWDRQMTYAWHHLQGIAGGELLELNAIRARLNAVGALNLSLDQRSVSVDEIEWIGWSEDELAEYDLVIDHYNAKPEADFSKVIVKNAIALNDGDKKIRRSRISIWQECSSLALVILGISMHLFRVRGHHYRAESKHKKEFYDTFVKTLNATTCQAMHMMLATPDETNGLFYCRSVTHAYGVLQPTILVFALLHRLPNSFTTRINAMVAGCAPVGVAMAALNLMEACPWWDLFYRVFREQIDTFRAIAAAICDNPLAYHLNSRLYGFKEAQRYNGSCFPEEALAPILPWIAGYIQSLPKESTIKANKCLEKRIQSCIGMASRFALTLEQHDADLAKNSDLTILFLGSKAAKAAEGGEVSGVTTLAVRK